MLFPTYQFVFFFLPLTLATFYLVFRLGKKTALFYVLLLFSLLFYLLPNWMHGHVIVASIVVNYWISKRIQASNAARSKWWLITGVIYNLAVIGYYKYSFFFGEIYTHFSGTELGFTKLLLPVGISFYTFQQIAYLADCYKHRDTHYKFSEYALFVAFFPQLIAGPIVHHREIMPQISALKNKSFNPTMLRVGFGMFVVGLFKKLVLADNLAHLADPVFESAASGEAIDSVSSWVATMSYTLQLYFDFSAYSDMAIGLGLMFGLKLPINFLSPYKATSIIDFWRRWHITLSRFLRDYLYIPLGGNRRGPLRRYINLGVTMILGGLWHGAGWTFIIWGALHGLYLMINHAFAFLRARANMEVPRILASTLTLLAVMVAWVFFRAENLSSANAIVYALFSFSSNVSAFNWQVADYALIALGWIIVLGVRNVAELFDYRGADTPEEWRPALFQPQAKGAYVVPLTMGVLFALALAFMPQPTVFIYFNF